MSERGKSTNGYEQLHGFGFIAWSDKGIEEEEEERKVRCECEKKKKKEQQ